jgi:hypothetical protein
VTLPLLLAVGLGAVAADEGDGSSALEEPSDSGDASDGQYNRELKAVEEDVNQLKERVFRSKATLQLLKELVIEGATLGSRVEIWHVNKMGPAYTMEEIRYFLDGKNIYTKVDPTGALDQIRDAKVHEQAVPPGQHNLQTNLVLRGNGFGIFSYLKTYAFKVQSSYAFEVEDGRACVVRVLANEKGGVGKSFVDRPNVQYEEKCEALRED